jgi:hypothetical protein
MPDVYVELFGNQRAASGGIDFLDVKIAVVMKLLRGRKVTALIIFHALQELNK